MNPSERLKHPCVNICNGWANDNGICTGCYRDIDQVRDWAKYSEEEKKEQMRIITKRKFEEQIRPSTPLISLRKFSKER